jgi:hypothetical protein
MILCVPPTGTYDKERRKRQKQKKKTKIRVQDRFVVRGVTAAAAPPPPPSDAPPPATTYSTGLFLTPFGPLPSVPFPPLVLMIQLG